MAKSAMQLFIEHLQQNVNGINVSLAESGLTTKERDYYNTARLILKDVITEANTRLAQERKQIEDAFGEGRISFSHEIGGDEFEEEKIESFKSASDYYQKTYTD